MCRLKKVIQGCFSCNIQTALSSGTFQCQAEGSRFLTDTGKDTMLSADQGWLLERGLHHVTTERDQSSETLWKFVKSQLASFLP